MYNKIRKITFCSLAFFFVFILIFLSHFVLDRNYYRQILSIMTIYVGYPSLFISIFLSIKNLFIIKKSELCRKSKIKYMLLNSFGFIIFIYLLFRVILQG